MRIETYIPGLSKNTVEIIKHAEELKKFRDANSGRP